MRKAVSAIVAIALILMMVVAISGGAYIWTNSISSSTQKMGSEQIEKTIADKDACISVDSVAGNTIYVRNCGGGIITNASIKVYVDGEPKDASLPSSIESGKVGALAISDPDGLSFGEHEIKIANGATEYFQTVIAETGETGWAMCYQETANISTACGGLSTGNYSFTAYIQPNGAYAYVNYTKPATAQNSSVWQVRHGNLSVSNLTIPASCWQQQPLQFLMQTHGFGQITSYSKAYCFQGSGWTILSTSTINCGSAGTVVPNIAAFYDGSWGTYYTSMYNAECGDHAKLYEEAMWWNISASTVNLKAKGA